MHIVQRGASILGSRGFGQRLGQATNFVRKIGNGARFGSELIGEVQHITGYNHPNLQKGKELLETVARMGD
jgi:hypothetical protein